MAPCNVVIIFIETAVAYCFQCYFSIIFRSGILKSEIGEIDQGWSETVQESGSREPDLRIPNLYKIIVFIYILNKV